MSSAYHPETDGQTEITNKTIEQYLRAMVHQNQRGWVDILPWAELWYNSSYHHSLKTSPFQVVYGRDSPEIIDYRSGNSMVEAVDTILTKRKRMLAELRKNLLEAQARMKKYADLKWKLNEFEEEQWVWLKLQPYRQHSVAHRQFQKLTVKFYGPFPIEKKISAVAYRLTLPPDCRIHPVFHIALLKEFKGDNPSDLAATIPPLTAESHPVIVPN